MEYRVDVGLVVKIYRYDGSERERQTSERAHSTRFDETMLTAHTHTHTHTLTQMMLSITSQIEIIKAH